MLSRSVRSTVLVLASATLASCGGDSGTDPGPTPEDPFFPADYASAYTQVADGRFSVPHSTCVEVYCSPGSASAYSNGPFPLPEGTVLVKEIYSGPATGTAPTRTCTGNLSGYVSMKKGAPGSSPASGDWSWQELDANRKVTLSTEKGNVDACIGCHIGYPSEDWTAIDPSTRF